MKVWQVAFTAASLIASTAQAREFGSPGGFDIAASESAADEPNGGFCGMVEEWEGPGDTRLIVFRYLKEPDMVAVIIDNYNWSIKKDEEYKVQYHLADKYFDRTAVGTEDSIRKGMLSFFPAANFLALFAKSNNFKVTKDDMTVDSLSLKGSGLAVDGFNRCWTYLRADEAAKQRERDRYSHIPKDPFKKPTE